jgi:hypothetical protein
VHYNHRQCESQNIYSYTYYYRLPAAAHLDLTAAELVLYTY